MLMLINAFQLDAINTRQIKKAISATVYQHALNFFMKALKNLKRRQNFFFWNGLIMVISS